MEISRQGFPEIISDNDEVYLQNLCGVIESVDELSCLNISRTPHSYNFRIAPSAPVYIESLLQEILKLNNMFGIFLDLSKSIKTSCVITFSIETNN